MTSQSKSSPQPATKAMARTGRITTGLVIVLLLLISMMPLFAVADLPSEAQGTLAAVFPPGTGKEEAMAAVAEADGLVVRTGSWDTVLIVHSDVSGFARRLRNAGAWLVADPQTAAGCLLIGQTDRNT